MSFNVLAFKMVPEGVKGAAKQVSEFLKSRGVPHAVIGGMAVSAYSPPRMTEDVDFLVPESALSDIREMGETSPLADAVDGVSLMVNDVIIDFIFVPGDMPEEALEGGPVIDGVPVLRPEALFLMKMHAPRAKDHADVIEMIKSGLVDLDAVREYVERHDPSMLDDLESNVALAEYEKRAGRGGKKKDPKVR